MKKTMTAGFLDKEEMIDAVSRLNQFLCDSGISAIVAVAAMKHLIALEEERTGMIVERIDSRKMDKQ